jgi:hypothetical protein
MNKITSKIMNEGLRYPPKPSIKIGLRRPFWHLKRQAEQGYWDDPRLLELRDRIKDIKKEFSSQYVINVTFNLTRRNYCPDFVTVEVIAEISFNPRIYES